MCFCVSQELIAEQQVQLVQYENAAGQCVSELQKAQLQVQSLQTKITEREAKNKVQTTVLRSAKLLRCCSVIIKGVIAVISLTGSYKAVS